MHEHVNRRDRAGSRRAVFLEVAYKLHAKDVYTIALRLLADERAAEEVTVSVFVEFGRNPPRWWDEPEITTRLRELAIAEALGRMRERIRDALRRNEQERLLTQESQETQGSGLAREPLSRAMMSELVNQLPDHLRAVFVLHDLEGVSAEGVAGHLRIDEPTISKLISQARLRLRSLWRAKV